VEIINNRYRIKELLNQDKHATHYSVYDMRDDNKVLLLHLLNSEYLPKSIIDFFVDRFIDIKNLTSERIVRNYNFNTLSYIDKQRQMEPQYFFTSDYYKQTVELIQLSKKLAFSQKISLFIDLCTVVYYLHQKGFIYGSLNWDTIKAVEEDGEYHILLQDIASVELTKLVQDEKIEYAFFKSPQVLAGIKPNETSDLYSLGVILLAIIRENSLILSPMDEVSNLASETNDPNVLQLVPLLEKLLTKGDSYESVYDVVVELNQLLQTDYSIVYKEEYEGLNIYTKLIGRENQVDTILRAYEKMVSYQTGNRIFFVQGANGIGKTRLLQEVNFLFDLSKASVYSSFSLNGLADSNKQVWIDILRKLIMETDQQIVEKYNDELTKYFPELTDKGVSVHHVKEEEITKYRLLNRIAGFISESIQSRPTAFIIDNIHLADDFTIDTFNYLCTEVLENTNLTLIFSCDDSEVSWNSVAMEFVNNMKKRADSETIRLEPLDENDTGEMIKSILTMPFVPKNLSRRIYSQSYGNPLFITEIMKDLYSRHVIYIHDETARWSIDLPAEDSNYNLLELPDSVEQALVNQLKDIDSFSIEILKIISIFQKPISIEIIEQFNLDSNSIEESLLVLGKNGVIHRLIDDSSYLFDFRSKVLKNIVYDKILPDEKLEKHRKAAELLEEKLETTASGNFDEIIYHYVQANDMKKVKMYYRLNACNMKAVRNTKAEIENLIHILELTENLEEKTELLIEIGSLLSDTGDIPQALTYLHDAEQLANSERNAKQIIAVNVILANANLLLYSNEKVLAYIDKVEKELTYYPDEEAQLEIKRIRAMLLLDDNYLTEAREQLLEVIEACGERYHKIKGNAYRTLGFIYFHIGKPEEALQAYDNSIQALEEIDYTRGVLLALNNKGAVYAEIYEDYDKAMEYHLQVKNLSVEYGIFTSEVFGLINIAEANFNKYEFETAYEHFNVALTKAERYKMIQEKFMILNFLTLVSLEMDRYSDAFTYFKRLRQDIEENPNKGFDIGSFYSTCAKFYQVLGNYDEADRYNQKVIAFHSENEHISKYQSKMNVLINQLRSSEEMENSILVDEILSVGEKITNKQINFEGLCDAINILSHKGDFVLAKKLLTKVHQYIAEDSPIRLMAIYKHAQGMVEIGENPENAIRDFEGSLALAKKSKSRELISRITADLGASYYALGKYYDAANYFLESVENIKTLNVQLPTEYRVNFMNGRYCANVFYHLDIIRKWVFSNQEIPVGNNHKPVLVTSLDDLDCMLRTNEITAFIRNQEFMQYISTQYMEQLSNGVLTEQDILKSLGNETQKKLDMIGKYLAGGTLATKGLIISEENGQDLTVLSSTNGNKQLTMNMSIFNRIRTTFKPILLSEFVKQDKLDHNLLPDDIRAIMCIPIIKHQAGQMDDSGTILGYIYLETDKVVNNFNQSGLDACTELVGLLVLVLEKRQLKISASIDKLTGALTRKYLEDSLQNTVDFSQKNGKEFSIIMFDLDKFKGVNDKYGHQIGDKVLREVSSIILDNLDSNRILGRYGGEEFIIILPSTNVYEAQDFAEMLRKKVQGQRILGDQQDITLSMGIASYPENGQTVRELILKADQALYVAKENGRNNSQIWQKDFESQAKPANKLTGIMSGDEIRDARNVLALVELIQLTNKDYAQQDKLYQFIGRVIEIMEAQYGYVLLIDQNSIMKQYGRKSQDEEWVDNFTYNPEIVWDVIQRGQGLFKIDWETTDKINMVNGLPDWDSILAVPIMASGNVKGVLYLSAPTRLKEFGADELNVLNVYSDLISNILLCDKE
jgi:diguanylate cyclase (GGDEF)-like protein